VSTFTLQEQTDLEGGENDASAGVKGLEKLGLDEKEKDTSTATNAEEAPTKPKDPLRMFGILTPLSLRQAQITSIGTLSTTIPALITTDLALQDLEIRIRRARKHKLKAEIQASTTGTEKGNKGGEWDLRAQQLLNGKAKAAAPVS